MNTEEVEKYYAEKKALWKHTYIEKRVLCKQVLDYHIKYASGDWYVGSMARCKCYGILDLGYPKGDVDKAIDSADEKTVDCLYEYLGNHIVVMLEHQNRLLQKRG